MVYHVSSIRNEVDELPSFKETTWEQRSFLDWINRNRLDGLTEGEKRAVADTVRNRGYLFIVTQERLNSVRKKYVKEYINSFDMPF